MPNAKHVVDVTFVVLKMGAEGREDFVFVSGVCNVGIGRCRGGSHSSSDQLAPEGIAKLEHIVFHDKDEGFGKRSERESRELGLIPHDVVMNTFDGSVGVDVGVHRCRVGSKEETVGREDESIEFLNQYKGAL